MAYDVKPSNVIEGLKDEGNQTESDTFTKEKQEIEKKEQERTTIKKELVLTIYGQTLGSVKATCEKAEIGRAQFYIWIKEDPEFNKRIKGAWKQKLEDVEQQLNKAILAGDVSAVKYFLDRRHPFYKPRVTLEGAIAGEKSAEDIFDDAEWLDDNKIYEATFEQHNSNTIDAPNSGQERTISAVQTDKGSDVLLEQKDSKKSYSESAPKGDK